MAMRNMRTVPDVYKACERFKELGVKFVKEPDGGSMKVHSDLPSQTLPLHTVKYRVAAAK